jgi:hypothetical protein
MTVPPLGLFAQMSPTTMAPSAWWDSPFALATVLVIGVVAIYIVALRDVPPEQRPAVIRELGKSLGLRELLRLLAAWLRRGGGMPPP